MKRLLTLDLQDYSDDMPVYVKHTVRAIIRRDGLIAMQQSSTGEYKIPGGVLEEGESHIQALVREVLEETGLTVKTDSVKEIGEVLELRRDLFDASMKYECHTYFYECDVEEGLCKVHMTESEIEKGFRPVWATPEDIVSTNRKIGEPVCCERDTTFIELFTK